MAGQKFDSDRSFKLCRKIVIYVKLIVKEVLLRYYINERDFASLMIIFFI
jgi:hypothetical protein